MKIISEKISIIKCPRCGCVYEWDTEDITIKETNIFGFSLGKRTSVECPKCKQERVLI